MVLKKRQEYGFNSFHVPFVPRAPRSARRRHLHDKKTEDGQICAFELLASLAGKLLRESEGSSASSNVSEMNDQPTTGVDAFKQEQVECTPPKIECIYQGSSGESHFVPECTLANGDQTCLLKESPRSEGDSVVEHSSIIPNSNSSEKASNDVKPVICESHASADDFPCKVEDGTSVSRRDVSVENLFNGNLNINGLVSGGLTINDLPSSNDTMGLYKKFSTLVNTDNSVKLPSCEDHVPNASILKLRKDSTLGTRDDDENFSRCHKPRTKAKALRPTSRIEDRRIRKLLTSKYWKVAPKLKDCEHSKVDGGMKPLFGRRKICRSHERFQSGILYKRRKFSDRSLVLTSDGGFSSGSVSNFMQFENGLAAMSPEENGVSSSALCRQASFNFKDSHVKFSIKSFRIPELFIKVPETTTVGSLKRTVMETVQAILGGGLRIGLVLHGKKVRDDNRTLLQTGITSKVNLDTLGFTLEPNFAQAPTLCTEDSPVPLSYNTPQIVSRSLAASVLDSGISDALHDIPLLTKSSNNTDTKCELASLYTDKQNDETPDSRVLAAVPPVTVDALSVVPVSQKHMRSELVQRRTRRPFSVSEVEALVQAVEELGTGRWRDVKLRSFTDADHRTYVDLKDKWKTLVHTAKISPQQRRGEPVPQEVLDRVLAAHAFWSQHQAKPHYGKNQAAAPKPLPVEGMFMM